MFVAVAISLLRDIAASYEEHSDGLCMHLWPIKVHCALQKRTSRGASSSCNVLKDDRSLG